MAVKIQYRRDTAANWTAANPVLAQGEPGYETDTAKFKVGNGTSTWTALPYSSGVTGNNLLYGITSSGQPSSAPSTSSFLEANGSQTISFTFPRTANVVVNSASIYNAWGSNLANVMANTSANGDVSLFFTLPTSRNVAVNSASIYNAWGSNLANVMANTSANGDVSLFFTLPTSRNVAVNSASIYNAWASNLANVMANTSANGDVSLFFTLPLSRNLTVNTASVYNAWAANLPNIGANTSANGDVSLFFTLPRAPNVNVGSVVAGAPTTIPIVTPFKEANGDITLSFTIPRGNIGNYNPKSISVYQPQAGDEFTIFYTPQALTLQNVITTVTSANTYWANSSVNANIYFGTDRWTGFATSILTYYNTGNTRNANACTVFSTASVPANNFVYIKINSVSNTPTEFHMSMQFTT